MDIVWIYYVEYDWLVKHFAVHFINDTQVLFPVLDNLKIIYIVCSGKKKKKMFRKKIGIRTLALSLEALSLTNRPSGRQYSNSVVAFEF